MKYKEFKKWLYENWDNICNEYEKSLAKNQNIPENYINVKDIDIGIPNNFNIVRNKDALYILPTEPKPIQVKFKENNNETV